VADTSGVGLAPSSAKQDREGREFQRWSGIPSERLKRIYERYANERRKPIQEWDFAVVERELQDIRRSSEDLGEIENSELLIKVIHDARLLKRDIDELERKKELARARIAESEKKEDDVSKAVHQSPKESSSKEFLASGWVVLVGKQSKVEGTHKLMKGNKTLFFLSSEQVDLNRYVNKRVGIRGYKKELDPSLGSDLVRVTEIRVLSN